MPLRYLTDDDETFDTIDEARAHEDELELQADLGAEVNAYLDARGVPPKTADSPGDRRTRSRRYNETMDWLRYDREIHPERYRVAPDPQPAEDPVVTAITGPK